MSAPKRTTKRRKVTRDVPPLTIDPARQFGRVCINGTRIPAKSVAWSVWAENGPDRSGSHDGVDGSADDFGTTREEALLACWWLVTEGYLNTISGQAKRKRQWLAWADYASRVLGGWVKNVRLCDPDEYEDAR